jgi:hypothetical protein
MKIADLLPPAKCAQALGAFDALAIATLVAHGQAGDTPELPVRKSKGTNQVHLALEVVQTLMKKQCYLSHETIHRCVGESLGAHFKLQVLNTYLSDWKKQDIIYDAGRGWYSSLPDEFPLNTACLEEMAKEIRKALPLLEFVAWSTEQTAPFRQHLPTSFVAYIYVDRETLSVIADRFMELWPDARIIAHPLGPDAAQFTVQGGRTIVLRPLLAIDSGRESIFLSMEEILVDLAIESDALGLMDAGEFKALFENIASRYRLRLSAVEHRARYRKTDLFGQLARMELIK